MKLRKVAAGILLAMYPVSVHWLLSSGYPQLTVWALLFLPATVITAGGLKKDHAIVFIAAIVILLAIGFFTGSVLPLILPPLLINLALCVIFGRTLLNGREALITRFARLIEGELPPDVILYTRRLTVVWCVLFAVLAVEVVMLAMFASPETWSLFANFLNYLFVLALFIFEYVYRRYRFRERSHEPLLQFFARLAKADWASLSLR